MAVSGYSREIKIFLKIQRFSLIFTVLLVLLVFFQTISGKYAGHLSLIWGWLVLLSFPLLSTLTLIRMNNFQLKSPRLYTETVFYSILIYFIFLTSILFIVIPIAWLNAQIGYIVVLKITFCFFVIFEMLLVLAILNMVNLFFSKKHSSAARRKENKLIKLAQARISLQKNNKLNSEEFIALLQGCEKKISENKSLEAIEKLRDFFKDHSLKEPLELILIQSDLKRTQQDQSLGLLDFKEANMKLTNLNKALLIFLRELEYSFL